MMPPAALPASSYPVTRFTASGLQYVRTSWKQGALPVKSVANIIEIPLHVSFSVANGNGAFFPFQSKDDDIRASVKSPFGNQSVHIRCPWNPPTTALRPRASSFHPISANTWLPNNMSRTIIVNLAIKSQSLSALIYFDLVITSGNFLPALTSNPSLQLSFIHDNAFSYSL